MHRTSLIALAFGLIPSFVRAQDTPRAIFVGTVVDSAQRPIPDAEVSLPDAKLRRLTDDQGGFRIRDVPAGPQHVIIRRIGFGQLDTTIVFSDNQTLQRRVTLGRVALLDSVVVGATRHDVIMEEFEENRSRGFGKFITRVQLDKMEGRTMGSAMSELQGLGVLRGHSGEAWILSKRAPISRCPPMSAAGTAADAIRNQQVIDNCLRSERLYYIPTDAESRQGLARVCFALVYLDRSPMNSGHPMLPFDANTFVANQLEAVEWYETSGDVPVKYAALDAKCGLAVFHARRSS